MTRCFSKVTYKYSLLSVSQCYQLRLTVNHAKQVEYTLWEQSSRQNFMWKGCQQVCLKFSVNTFLSAKTTFFKHFHSAALCDRRYFLDTFPIKIYTFRVQSGIKPTNWNEAHVLEVVTSGLVTVTGCLITCRLHFQWLERRGWILESVGHPDSLCVRLTLGNGNVALLRLAHSITHISVVKRSKCTLIWYLEISEHGKVTDRVYWSFNWMQIS